MLRLLGQEVGGKVRGNQNARRSEKWTKPRKKWKSEWQRGYGISGECRNEKPGPDG